MASGNNQTGGSNPPTIHPKGDTVITFTPSTMNAVQLAKLYKFLISIHRLDDAQVVYEAGVANCGAADFCCEVSRA